MKQSQYITQIAQPAYNALVAEHGGKGSAAWKEKAKELIAEHEERKASSYKGFKTNDQDQALAMKQLMTAWKKDARDRKSTCLNSSHANISYAVFCLKKKKIKPLMTVASSAGSCDRTMAS